LNRRAGLGARFARDGRQLRRLRVLLRAVLGGADMLLRGVGGLLLGLVHLGAVEIAALPSIAAPGAGVAGVISAASAGRAEAARKPARVKARRANLLLMRVLLWLFVSKARRQDNGSPVAPVRGKAAIL